MVDFGSKLKDMRINKHLSQEQLAKRIKIAQAGGNHDILFFLKSLDVDLRCGYTLGTVCGYGRTKF